MSDDKTIAEILAPRAPHDVNDSPLQLAGLDQLQRREVIGGPETKQDIRLVLTENSLSVWLEVAERSATLRAIIKELVITVGSYVTDDGHTFQLMTLGGLTVEPEVSDFIRSPEPDFISPERFGDQQPDDAPGRQLDVKRIGEGDLRMYLSRNLLKVAQEAARASSKGRAVIHQAGLVIDSFVDLAGHHYKVMTIMGLRPKPDGGSGEQPGSSVGGF